MGPFLPKSIGKLKYSDAGSVIPGSIWDRHDDSKAFYETISVALRKTSDR